MTTPLDLAIVIASTRDGRRGPAIARWLADVARGHGAFTVDLTDLRDHPDGADGFGARLDTADAVLVVVPEYNHSFPAPLKAALDSLGWELAGKPVSFVSYGGRSGGIRAVEHLRLVLAELHAVTPREGVTLHEVWSSFIDDAPVDVAGVTAATEVVLDRLAWWATVLRDGRTRTPYAA